MVERRDGRVSWASSTAWHPSARSVWCHKTEDDGVTAPRVRGLPSSRASAAACCGGPDGQLPHGAGPAHLRGGRGGPQLGGGGALPGGRQRLPNGHRDQPHDHSPGEGAPPQAWKHALGGLPRERRLSFVDLSMARTLEWMVNTSVLQPVSGMELKRSGNVTRCLDCRVAIAWSRGAAGMLVTRVISSRPS